MKGLIIKDLFTLANFRKQYGLILLFMAVWSLVSKSFSFLAMYIILLGGMMVLSIMSMDETVHFNRYALTMPISVRTLIKEKYVMTCICIAAGSLLALVVEGIAMLTPWNEGAEEWIVLAAISAFFLLAYTVTLPFIFKFGVEKARYIYMAVMGIMAVVIAGGVYLTKNTPVMMFDGVPKMSDVVVYLGILLLLDAVVVSVSYRISLKVVKNKEW